MRAVNSSGPVLVHSDAKIVYASDAVRSLVGAPSRGDLIGASLLELVRQGDREPLTAQFERIASGEASTLGLTVCLEPHRGKSRKVVVVSSSVEWAGTERIHSSIIEIGTDIERPVGGLREPAMEQAPVGITIADVTREDEPLIYVNDQFVELTGYPREEAIGQNCRFLQGEQTREQPVTKMRAAIEARESVTVEIQNHRKDGSVFWNRVTLSPVTNDDGTVTHYLGFQEDVSTEKIYQRERTLFERQAEAADQVILVTDAEGTIEYVNPAFERQTGYTASEAIGTNPRLLKSGDQDEAFYRRLWETITDGEVWEGQLTNRRKSGERYYVEQRIVPITDSYGDITHFVAIEQDITDDRLTEQVLEVLDRVLRHNLRTTVNVIEGYTELLSESVSEPDQRAAVAVISDRVTALEKLHKQVETIRTLFRDRQETTLWAVSDLEALIEECRVTFPEATINFDDQTTAEPEIKNGDVLPIAIEEVIENAVTHSDRDAPTVTVTVSETADGQWARIDIADDGPGIPDQEWKVVSTGTETPLAHGSGIGLWLLYWTVTAVGGTVERSDNDPRGTIISLEVPLLNRDGSSDP